MMLPGPLVPVALDCGGVTWVPPPFSSVRSRHTRTLSFDSTQPKTNKALVRLPLERSAASTEYSRVACGHGIDMQKVGSSHHSHHDHCPSQPFSHCPSLPTLAFTVITCSPMGGCSILTHVDAFFCTHAPCPYLSQPGITPVHNAAHACFPCLPPLSSCAGHIPPAAAGQPDRFLLLLRTGSQASRLPGQTSQLLLTAIYAMLPSFLHKVNRPPGLISLARDNMPLLLFASEFLVLFHETGTQGGNGGPLAGGNPGPWSQNSSCVALPLWARDNGGVRQDGQACLEHARTECAVLHKKILRSRRENKMHAPHRSAIHSFCLCRSIMRCPFSFMDHQCHAMHVSAAVE